MNSEQLNNLKVLRDEVFPVVFEMDKQGRVHLNTFEVDDCGTPGCLLGWYKHLTNKDYFDYAASAKHFGITTRQDGELFCADVWREGTYKCLQDRYKYLCQLIKDNEPKDLPDWNAP